MLESIIGILGLLGGFGFGALRYWKYVKALKEILDLIKVTGDVFADGKLSPEEQQLLFKEIMDIPRSLGLIK